MEYAIMNKPIRRVVLTVEQIVALRSMLRLELVTRLNDLMKVSMFVAFKNDHKLSEVIGDTSAEIMAMVGFYETLERPLVSALGSPFTAMVLDKYRLDKEFEVFMISTDFDKLAKVVLAGAYSEYIKFSVEHESEEDDFHSFIPTLLMLRNQEALVKLFKKEPKVTEKEVGAYSMPQPRGNYKN